MCVRNRVVDRGADDVEAIHFELDLAGEVKQALMNVVEPAREIRHRTSGLGWRGGITLVR